LIDIYEAMKKNKSLEKWTYIQEIHVQSLTLQCTLKSDPSNSIEIPKGAYCAVNREGIHFFVTQGLVANKSTFFLLRRKKMG
jgi:hypothetical protein